MARTELSESISSFMRFGRKHEGQIPTCRKCHLPERVLMLFVSTVISWVTPSVTVTRILNAASVRRMVIMPLIVACPGGVALPGLTLAFLLLIHTLRLIFRTLLLMCLLLILHLLLMFLNALCLFPRLSLCLILSSHPPSDVPRSCPPSVPPLQSSLSSSSSSSFSSGVSAPQDSPLQSSLHSFAVYSRFISVVSKRRMPLVASCEIKPCPSSDHNVVYLSIESSRNNSRGPGIFGNSITRL